MSEHDERIPTEPTKEVELTCFNRDNWKAFINWLNDRTHDCEMAARYTAGKHQEDKDWRVFAFGDELSKLEVYEEVREQLKILFGVELVLRSTKN